MYPDFCDDGQARTDRTAVGTVVTWPAWPLRLPTMRAVLPGVGWKYQNSSGARAWQMRRLSLSDIAEAIRWAAGLPVAGVPTNTTPAQVINLESGWR